VTSTMEDLKGVRSVHALNSSHCLLPPAGPLPPPQVPAPGFGGLDHSFGSGRGVMGPAGPCGAIPGAATPQPPLPPGHPPPWVGAGHWPPPAAHPGTSGQPHGGFGAALPSGPFSGMLQSGYGHGPSTNGHGSFVPPTPARSSRPLHASASDVAGAAAARAQAEARATAEARAAAEARSRAKAPDEAAPTAAVGPLPPKIGMTNGFKDSSTYLASPACTEREREATSSREWSHRSDLERPPSRRRGRTKPREEASCMPCFAPCLVTCL